MAQTNQQILVKPELQDRIMRLLRELAATDLTRTQVSVKCVIEARAILVDLRANEPDQDLEDDLEVTAQQPGFIGINPKYQ